jgi:Holliday junction DNA helicase RuvA
MISFVRGKLVEKTGEHTIVDVHGVGFKISVPSSTYSKLPEKGEEIEVYTYMYVREDALRLYGFLSLEELDIFERLINVSGVGPKAAINIMSGVSVSALKNAIDRGDVGILMSIAGIGKKTAQRLILELKGKLEIREVVIKKEVEEAIVALVSLGYTSSDARTAVNKAASESKSYTVEDLVKKALKLI